MVLAFDHIHIYAADPEATLGFYRDVFGAEYLGVTGSNTLILLGGQVLAVSAFPEGMTAAAPPAEADGALPTGHGVAHVGLNVDDLEATIVKLKAAGAHVHSEPRGQAPLRYVYFTGPDGVVVELTQYVLPRKLVPVERALRGFNRAVHVARRTITRQLLRAAQA